jgi:hypothetical protein
MKLYYWIRCQIGKPVCYRSGVFAMCKSCHRQSEIHQR